MKKELPLKPIQHAKIKAGMSVDKLMLELDGCGFGAGKLASAAQIFENMVKSDAMKFFGLSGAMVPSGMRQIISDMIRDGYIDVLVTTGANLVHDLIESLGGHHYKGTEDIDSLFLKNHHLNRIFDVLLPEEHFERLEEHLLEVYANMENNLSIREFITEIGKSVDDKNSILKSAVDSDVPVFCPAIQDSIIGLHAWLFKQTKPLKVDVFDDMREFMDICYSAKKTGAIMIGGGVPKNYILQSMLLSSKGGFDYFIQLTTDRPESGGLSGATFNEAKTWDKVKESAKAVTVYSDATITLPLIVASVKERLES